MREHSRGHVGHPAIEGHRGGKSWSTRFTISSHTVEGNTLTLVLDDQHAELNVELIYALDVEGILKVSAKLTNVGQGRYYLNNFTYWLPLPEIAQEVLDFTGRWSHERNPQRRDIAYGLTTREIREGRSGHDYTIAQLGLTRGANFQSGQVWSLSVAWSGNSVHHIERLPDGSQSIGAGELLLPGEIVLEAGSSFSVAPVIANYSSTGIDGLSNGFYAWLRSRPQHPTNIRPRPLTLNVWEAVYFDHNEAKIRALVDVAAEIGIERMVLDDGWFLGRRDDTAGLGDWVIDPKVWPHGFSDLIAYMNSKGIEFGLWFEGEMINPDSDLYRSHPEWVLQEGERKAPLWRNQLVLDLSHEGAFAHVLEQTSSVLSAHKIAYIKWDHNRILNDAGHLGKASVHQQTQAIYKLFDELKRRHPGLEIESCASGGARIDLGMIEHADRFWTRDNNDALERQVIQRWTGIAIPPEMLGSHIGPTRGHQTGRTHNLLFRSINALFGHAGIEWDVTETTPEERSYLKRWADLYKEKRELLHSGDVVRVEHPDPHAYLYGVVAKDKESAIYAFMQHRMNESNFPPMLRLVGLSPEQTYRVSIRKEIGDPKVLQIANPPWVESDLPVDLTGQELAHIGLRAPILSPENGILIECVAV
jgi:alpha-galactosidase